MRSDVDLPDFHQDPHFWLSRAATPAAGPT